MRVVTLAGSPRFPSRSAALLTRSQKILESRGVEVLPWNIQHFEPADLIQARFDAPAISLFKEDLASAQGLIIATPVYKASYSGALKTVLDLLPERALENKVVLPVATAGSHAHMLAIDYALKPVLGALKARDILHGVFANDSQIIPGERDVQIDDVILTRLNDELDAFLNALNRLHRVSAELVA
ncbi:MULTISPECIES: NADPH-dependent FMN reductase [Tatumella]|uniref:NADPH-dependent FMN reductase n=1 Tax=Tatumella punctata TaxID=399969 RepID=A0ABW1VLP0_9GAMM|nr:MULTISPECIES: NADPH-dependent FMN reductase [unclassified Tatumella]MBS0855649.1 NADPH-dependent FMN reductase [Tatumella sp. JGM16]MBS0876630.1 NADPH-dependent FMN reductase [Tatumella sp. JGM82]MBS0889983.1 NADPH-dependent FMN reductase [Tatumella sp. JGM94]MBS0893155.1 NADPH-dependent FMN reductase [Tatumella sp. JGM130]MBS0901227.1 NADPH-dependent FMN reductase [Tatumella sp. JGM100]